MVSVYLSGLDEEKKHDLVVCLLDEAQLMKTSQTLHTLWNNVRWQPVVEQVEGQAFMVSMG